jgi:hypothetical protein
MFRRRVPRSRTNGHPSPGGQDGSGERHVDIGHLIVAGAC